jgi:hypothetical protein
MGGGPRTFSVTVVRPTSGLPSFEVGAYEYVGERLPEVGETISVQRIAQPDGGDAVRGYVTRVDATAETPISVTAVTQEQEPDRAEDDLLA